MANDSYIVCKMVMGFEQKQNCKLSVNWALSIGTDRSDVSNALDEDITAEDEATTIDPLSTNEVVASEPHKESPIVNDQYAERVATLLANNQI